MKKILATLVALILTATAFTAIPIRSKATNLRQVNGEMEQYMERSQTADEASLSKKEEAILMYVLHVERENVKHTSPTSSTIEYLGEVDMGFYIVLYDNITMKDIATDLLITDQYLLSVNPYSELDEVIPRGLYVEVPDGDWKYINKNIYVKVAPGNTLSQLADYFYMDEEEILELNPKIKDPNLIYIDQIIRIK